MPNLNFLVLACSSSVSRNVLIKVYLEIPQVTRVMFLKGVPSVRVI